MEPDLETVMAVLAGVAVLALCLALVLLVYVYRRLHRLDVPEGAGFFATLRLVPLALVVALDLLDLALDVFATPIVWVVLRRFRLQALRDVATFEALIPFTGPIPTLTMAWFAARWFDLGDRPRRPERPERPALPGPKRP